MGNNNYKIEECYVTATLVNGDNIEIPYVHMRYDSSDQIYWYKDKSLTDIKILDPNKNPQNHFKVFM